MLNKTIAPGGFTLIHSNPSDENNGPVNPPSDVTWGLDTGDFGTLSLQGNLNRDAMFQSAGSAGITTVTMACQGKQAQVTVTMEAPIILPFDHFSPSFD